MPVPRRVKNRLLFLPVDLLTITVTHEWRERGRVGFDVCCQSVLGLPMVATQGRKIERRATVFGKKRLAAFPQCWIDVLDDLFGTGEMIACGVRVFVVVYPVGV